MCVCVCVCVCMCVCVCACTRVYMQVCEYALCGYTYACVHVNVYTVL